MNTAFGHRLIIKGGEARTATLKTAPFFGDIL